MSNINIKECPNCHEEFETSKSNRKHSWGKFCSKKCKTQIQSKRQNRKSKSSRFYDDYDDNHRSFDLN